MTAAQDLQELAEAQEATVRRRQYEADLAQAKADAADAELSELYAAREILIAADAPAPAAWQWLTERCTSLENVKSQALAEVASAAANMDAPRLLGEQYRLAAELLTPPKPHVEESEPEPELVTTVPFPTGGSAWALVYLDGEVTARFPPTAKGSVSVDDEVVVLGADKTITVTSGERVSLYDGRGTLRAELLVPED